MGRPLRQTFERDHVRLIALIQAAEQDTAAGRVMNGGLTMLSRQLRSHMRIEEELFFPALDRTLAGEGHQVTKSLRREHSKVSMILDEIERSRGRDDRAAVVASLRELEATVRVHEDKEEDALHPLLDQLVSVDAIVDLAAMLAEDPA